MLASHSQYLFRSPQSGPHRSVNRSRVVSNVGVFAREEERVSDRFRHLTRSIQPARCYVAVRAEGQRILKRREELTRQISAMKGRLGNAGYIAKAPPKLVQETKDQLATAEEELKKLG